LNGKTEIIDHVWMKYSLHGLDTFKRRVQQLAAIFLAWVSVVDAWTDVR